MFCLGVFQYVWALLLVTVSLDHPVTVVFDDLDIWIAVEQNIIKKKSSCFGVRKDSPFDNFDDVGKIILHFFSLQKRGTKIYLKFCSFQTTQKA